MCHNARQTYRSSHDLAGKCVKGNLSAWNRSTHRANSYTCQPCTRLPHIRNFAALTNNTQPLRNSAPECTCLLYTSPSPRD
eukprot:13354890-Alexandrium_andersonii.AAC.1